MSEGSGMDDGLDCIALRGVSGFGFHGVLAHERRDGQDFSVDVDLYLDLAPAAASDDLHMTVDYGTIADRTYGLITGEAFDLIEKLAGSIAAMCLEYDRVQHVVVAVHKPQAPISVPFTDVIVRVTRTRTHRAILSLGANMGDRFAALQGAVKGLAAHPGISVGRGSSVFATKPVGGVEQDDFLNAVVAISTSLSPDQLLAAVQGIENDWHRVRDVRWGPRSLDIDIIAFDDLVQHDDVLTLPHPRAHERAFVCVPWSEIDESVSLDGLDLSGVERTDLVLDIP